MYCSNPTIQCTLYSILYHILYIVYVQRKALFIKNNVQLLPLSIFKHLLKPFVIIWPSYLTISRFAQKSYGPCTLSQNNLKLWIKPSLSRLEQMCLVSGSDTRLWKQMSNILVYRYIHLSRDRLNLYMEIQIIFGTVQILKHNY